MVKSLNSRQVPIYRVLSYRIRGHMTNRSDSFCKKRESGVRIVYFKDNKQSKILTGYELDLVDGYKDYNNVINYVKNRLFVLSRKNFRDLKRLQQIYWLQTDL